MPTAYNPNFQRVLPDLLGPDLVNFERGVDCYVLDVYTGAIVRVLTLLRDHPQCLFKQLVDITVVDYPSKLQRFELVYHLLSHQLNRRLRIKCHADESLLVPSSIGVFPNSNWYEREIWDLFGIYFSDHPDLRRILTDYNFSGHPLRKDFPLSGFVQVRFNEDLGRVANEPVNLSQEYRDFDFLSPWEGMLQPKELPGDEKAQKNDDSKL